ncbi:hypothetical protein [Streptomyces sp. YIM S03343]
MGDRQSGDGVPGRRHAHPDGSVPGTRRVTADGGLEALLAAAIRADEVDPVAEQRAVAAFSAARDAGALTARPRGRDDWRPRETRRNRRSLKVTLSVAVAGLTLGGVAYAGIGAGGSGEDDGAHPGGTTPSAGARDGSSGATADGGAPSGSASTGRPDTAQDTAAHCRAYEQVKDRGKALDSTAWQRLVDAAGGTANVEAYCADQLARAAQDKAAKTTGANPNSTSDANPRSTATTGGNANGGGNGNASDSGNANGNSDKKATKTPGKG